MEESILDIILELRSTLTTNNTKEGENLIYFLIRDDVVVYVGQTKRGVQRILSHSLDKKFDSFSYYQLPSSVDLNELEAYYIFSLLPEYNRSIPFNYRFIHIDQLHIEPFINFPLVTHCIGKSFYIDLKILQENFSIVVKTTVDKYKNKLFYAYRSEKWLSTSLIYKEHETKLLIYNELCTVKR